jgi:probable H4MPT-linked C1 transfer pathway protein
LFLALDVGGANIKASAFEVDGAFALRSAKLHYPLWIRGVDGLPKAIEQTVALLGCDLKGASGVALTMTAELSDVFRDKKEGVDKVLRKAEEVLGGFKVVTNDGSLLDPDEAVNRYMDVAATNWWCVGWLASLLERDCLVVDVGSTTTTITPVVEGKVAAKGLNDVEKMTLGEIIYVGALRTPISSVASIVPVNGLWCRTSSEYFANVGDVNLVLGLLREEEYDVATPDGRGKSVEECHERLSRVVCGDRNMLKPLQTRLVARFVYEKVVEKVSEGVLQVLSRLASEGRYPEVGFAAGLGDFIALDAVKRAGLRGVLLRDLLGRDNSIALTSASLALYLAYKTGVDVGRWISSLR